MSLEEIEWTESEGDTDDNLELENLDVDSEDEPEYGRREPARATRRARDEDLDPEVEEAYQGARGLYTQGDYNGALLLLEEAIKHEAGSKLLFNLLASIHEERRDFEKALLARINVAVLDKRDKDTWIDVAERSMQLGHLGQAAWCFQQVSRLDRNNWQWLRTRADLHTQIGQQTTALSLLQRIRTKFFNVIDHDARTQTLLSIAGLLKDLGRSDEATRIYMDVFVAATTGQRGEVELDWQNLNILCELLTDQKQYSRVVTVVKTGSRYINGRGDQMFWQQFSAETDAEFDGRRKMLVNRLAPADKATAVASIEQSPAAYDMPIDIRIWLLQARLKLVPPHLLLQAQTAVLESLPAVRDAREHLGFLRECHPVEMFSDLFKKGALAFFEARLYAESRELYVALTAIEHESEAEYLEMTVQVAKCEMELHNVGRAESLYKYVLERDPASQEALVAMGEIYAASDRKEESLAALKKLEAVRSAQQMLNSQRALDKNDTAPTDNFFEHEKHRAEAAAGNVFVDQARQRSANARPSRAERAEVERGAQARADAAFAGLARFQSGLDAGNEVAALEWLRHADELVDMFAAHRKFFPTDKQKDFFEGSSNSSVDQRIERLRLVQLDRQAAMDDPEEASDDELDAIDDAMIDNDSAHGEASSEDRGSFVWRGQPLSMWFWVCMQSALVHAKAGDADRAQQIVATAQAANVFSFDRRRGETMQLVALSCAYLGRRPELIADLLRHSHMLSQFNPVIYRLYVALLSASVNTSQDALEVFASSNNQKFFLRQIKALDSIIHHKKPVSGMAKVLDPDNAPQHEDPQMLVLYAYIMLLGPSYSPALTYLIRVRALLPDHPLVLLVYAVVQMHRVTQRTSLNRHLQLLEGLSFMQEYAAKRGDLPEQQQEVKYNLGRFFHGVGLLSLAVRYYEEALDFDVAEEDDLSREAAYNLHLIYAESGNMELSAEVVNKYLVV